MILKTLRTIVLAGFVSLAGLFSATAAVAASQAECAIWLCLPGGFPAGCGAAHSAMMDRIDDGKSPLPSFGSCDVEAGPGASEMSADYGYAALIAEQRECTRYEGLWSNRTCAEWRVIPEHYRKGVRCSRDKEGYRSPEGCVGTSRYIDVYVDGLLSGDTYYWGNVWW